MRYFLIFSIIFSLASCKESKQEITEIDTTLEIPTKDVEEIEVFNKYEDVFNMLQGSWANTLDPNSVVIFEGNTCTNMYQDKIAQKGVPYKISTNCTDEVAAIATTDFRYINTEGLYTECYRILHLDKDTLELEFKKGNITLTFNRLKVE